MRNFGYVQVDDPATAVAALVPGARLIAGGTEMINLLKERIVEPSLLIDISRVPLNRIAVTEDGLHLGALAHMSDVAADPAVRRAYPGIAEALELSASAQLRNMATMGGNLLQRTRCPYFRADYDLPCNKRRPGSGCAVLAGGSTRAAALFGASDHCVATHPSDVAVMLAALDAQVQVTGPAGARVIELAAFHRLPGDEPDRDTTLEPDEMITGIDVPASPEPDRSHYVKVRERASYEFALVSAAVAVALNPDLTIRSARVALGGVAPRPWRLTAAEQALAGLPADPDALAAAIAPAFADARPLPGNEFKINLAQRTVLRALQDVIR